MARAPRPVMAGGIYHVTTRANRNGPACMDDYDRRHFVTLLARAVARYEWRCHAWCLLTTHYHLLLETPKPNLSHRAMVGLEPLHSFLDVSWLQGQLAVERAGAGPLFAAFVAAPVLS